MTVSKDLSQHTNLRRLGDFVFLFFPPRNLRKFVESLVTTKLMEQELHWPHLTVQKFKKLVLEKSLNYSK